MGYSKREWRLFSFGMVMLVGSLLIQFALPSFTGRVITALSEEKYSDINTICLELFVIVLVSQPDMDPTNMLSLADLRRVLRYAGR